MKKSIIALIFGVVLLLLGHYQHVQYEKHAVTVNATITDIKIDDESWDNSPNPYHHHYYGEYSILGEKYIDKKLKTLYENSPRPKYQIGDILEVEVINNNPASLISDGVLLQMVGDLLILYNAFSLYKKIRNKKSS